MAQTPELPFHHYDASTFSEKIRLTFVASGFAGAR